MLDIQIWFANTRQLAEYPEMIRVGNLCLFAAILLMIRACHDLPTERAQYRPSSLDQDGTVCPRPVPRALVSLYPNGKVNIGKGSQQVRDGKRHGYARIYSSQNG